MARARPLNGTADTTVSDIATDGIQRYFGITVRCTSAAVFRIREGSNTGAILDTFSLDTDESVTTWYGPMGKECRGDLVEDWVSGAYEGSVFVG